MLPAILAVVATAWVAASHGEPLLLDAATEPTFWSINLGEEFPGASGELSTPRDPSRGQCLGARFVFAGESRYAGLQWHGQVPEARAIGFWIKLARRSRGIIRVRDSTGQEHLGGFDVAAGRWTRVEIPLVPASFGAHWGGADDGRLHFPLRTVLIGVGRGPDEAQMRLSTLYASVPSVEPQQQWAIWLEVQPAMGVAFRGERAEWTAKVLRRIPQPGSCRVRVEAQQPGRAPRTLVERVVEVSPAADWQRRAPAPAAIRGTLPTGRLGYTCLRAFAVTPAGATAAAAGLAVVPRPRRYGVPDPQCYFGLQGGLDPAVAERLGAKAVRLAPGWRWAEPRPGRIRWAEYLDRAVLPAAQHHMQILLTLQAIAPSWVAWKVKGEPKLSRLPDPSRLDAYRRFVQRVAARYRHDVAAVEIQNEPDLTCWRHPGLSFEEGARYYATLLEAGWQGVKAAAPEIPVAGLDVSGGDFRGGLKFTRAVLDLAADKLDLFTGHPYATPRYFGRGQRAKWPTAGKLADKCRAALDLLVQYGRPRRMWIGELGWALDASADPLSRHSLDFAACVAQALIVGRTVAGVEKFLYFTMLGCNEHGYEYGLFRGRPAYPLPAASAYATCAYVLHRVVPLEASRLAGGLFRAAFEAPKRREFVIAWFSTDRPYTLAFAASAPGGTWLDGFGRTLRPAGGKVDVGTMPVYWIVSQSKVGSLQELLAAVKARPQ